jgi:hypothetical protein
VEISLNQLALVLKFILLEFIELRSEFVNRIWKQIRGIVMGTNCVPLVANLLATYYKLEYALSLEVPQLSPLFWCSRYIDNLFFVLRHPVNQ